MNLHKLLLRQLNRCHFKEGALPSDINEWSEFLECITRTYVDTDQERYLLERSMEISSRELLNLNSKLENAQHIGRLGYWTNDRSTGKITWSKEIYYLLGFDPTKPAPSFEEILQLEHEEDRIRHLEAVERAFSEGKDYEIEIRFRDKEGHYHWYRSVGHPHVKEGQPITKLSGVLLDIEGKKIQEEIFMLNQQLVASARRAGMSDAATSVLHNIGNILNSVNVSLGLLHENIDVPYYNKLFAIDVLLQEHEPDISQYLTEDPKGKLILKYLDVVMGKIKENHSLLRSEISKLREHVEHIRNITEMQKSISGSSYGANEKVYIRDVIDTVFKICGDVFEKYNIRIIIDCSDIPLIMTDKSKLLQILVNLVQNAKDSVVENNNFEKKIAITVKKISSKIIEINIEDNGIGILKENLTKIFSYGFTTKSHGHGFGLHSCALVAKELGGKLEVASKGNGKGATFILTLPVSTLHRRDNNESKK